MLDNKEQNAEPLTKTVDYKIDNGCFHVTRAFSGDKTVEEILIDKLIAEMIKSTSN